MALLVGAEEGLGLWSRHQADLRPEIDALLGSPVAAEGAMAAVVLLIRPKPPAVDGAPWLSRLAARVSRVGAVDCGGATRGLIVVGEVLADATHALVVVVDAVVLPAAPFAIVGPFDLGPDDAELVAVVVAAAVYGGEATQELTAGGEMLVEVAQALVGAVNIAAELLAALYTFVGRFNVVPNDAVAAAAACGGGVVGGHCAGEMLCVCVRVCVCERFTKSQRGLLPRPGWPPVANSERSSSSSGQFLTP